MPPITRGQAAQMETEFYDYVRNHLKEEHQNFINLNIPIGPLGDINRITLYYKFADWRFGEVYACQDPDITDCPRLLIRRFDKTRLDEFSVEPIIERILVRPLLYHGLPQFVKRMRDAANLFLVTKDVPVGCFNRLLPSNRNGRRIGEDEAKPYLHQVYKALEYLHNISIIHRCVCLDHCLIFAHGQVKVFEFTCATTQRHPTELIGNRKFCAPEMYRDQPYDFSVDWWALGVLVYKLFLDKYPFTGVNDDDLMTAVLTQRPADLLAPEITTKLSDFLEKLLEKEPSDRLGFDVNNRSDAIRNHVWFKENLSGEWTAANYKNPNFKMDIWQGTPVAPDLFKNSEPESEADAKYFELF